MLRTSLAILAGKAARVASRLRGGGSALPGLVAERIDPDVLAHALANVSGGIVVVTGTNGKTTTTRMLVAILREHGRRVFTNPTGSNFTRGVISAMLGEIPLSGRLGADLAVVELDEAHALRFAQAVPPTHALLLNVARDQLDRFAEIDHTAALLAALAAQTTMGVVLNRDDAFVARIATTLSVPPGTPSAPTPTGNPGTASRPGLLVRYFGLHPSIAHRLPELSEADVRFDEEAEVPPVTDTDALLTLVADDRFKVLFGAEGGGNDVGPLRLRQRGLAAMINATAATAMARLLLGQDFRESVAEAALQRLDPPFGRGETIDADGRPLELVLVKNPSGFTVALATYAATPATTMIAINDNYADGRDVSWLYDVAFDSLRGAGVALTSGVRGYDMALRLAYDGVRTEEVELDLQVALERLLRDHPGQPLRVFCTYTAMMALRRLLAARYDLAAFGEEVQRA
ncbi:MAG TPA: DUF1727 domain-containing protein [Dermatophilaceae bacterium]|nr:DUF1727 domain-containing protein [Dermatophilaceae bacterium]